MAAVKKIARSRKAGGSQGTGSGQALRLRRSPGVADIRRGLGLRQPEFARMTGYSVRAVAGWETGRAVSDSARQKMTEMERLRLALAGLMEPGQIGEWLRAPNRAFDGQTPLQVVERGEIDRLWRMVFQLQGASAT